MTSQLDTATFNRYLIESQTAFPQERAHLWFQHGREPAIRVNRANRAEIDEIVRTIRCCGLSEAASREVLLSLLGTAQTGEVSVRRFYELAFTRALARAGVNDPYCVDCMSTALTYFNARYFAGVDNADIPNFGPHIFGNLYREIPSTTPLRWGDFVVVERNGERVHIMVYLSNGLVLHKAGPFAPATIEPFTAGREFYREYYASNHPGQPNDIQIRTWRRQP